MSMIYCALSEHVHVFAVSVDYIAIHSKTNQLYNYACMH